MQVSRPISQSSSEMNQSQDERGSIWRKWDLHIHTPASFQWNGQTYRNCETQLERDSITRQVIEAMNTADAAVFGIMDYWTFDGYMEIRKLLRQNPELCRKTILPGIELRIQAPTDFRLNIHVLLSDELTDQQIFDFKSHLKVKNIRRNLSDEALIMWAKELDDSKAKHHGFNSVKTLSDNQLLLLGSQTAEITNESFQLAIESLPQHSYVVILPYGSYGGVEGLNWKDQATSDIYFMRLADIFESRDQDDVDIINGFRTDKNKTFIDNFIKTMGGKGKPAISGSDAHSTAFYGVYPLNKATWIKADATFRGLRQVLNEPRDRCFIGDTPAQISRVKSNPTKYIQSVHITKNHDSSLDEEVWFDNKVVFNPGLVAIIGNKGNGKSALLDIIGLISGYNKEGFFSFLNKNRFRNARKNKAKHFSATLVWESGISSIGSLDEIPLNSSDNVRYIPQNFFEKICNETEIREDSDFDKELESVIFSHVNDYERLGFGDLRSLIDYKTEEINRTIADLIGDLSICNTQIIQLEHQLTPEYRTEQELHLKKKQEELSIHEANQPAPIDKPQVSSSISNEIDSLRKEEEDVKSQKLILHEELENSHRQLSIIDKIINQIILFKSQYDRFVRDIEDDLLSIEQNITAVVSINISDHTISTLRSEVQAHINTLTINIDTLDHKILEIVKAIHSKRSMLENTHQTYQSYLSNLSLWETRKLEIIGDKDTVNTIFWYQEKIDEIDNIVQERLNEKIDLRTSIINDIYQQKNKIKDVYRMLYRPVQEFINTHPLIKDVYKLKFEVSLKVTGGFYDAFFRYVKRNAGGTFQGTDDGLQVLKDIAAKYDLDKEDDIRSFVENIMEYLKYNQKNNRKPMDLAHQLKTDTAEFYNFVYGLSYIEPDYALTLDDKKLYQLSPGERGILLLIFYLLIDNNDCPLIIDQPEENIDNQSIVKLLVPCIKIAKNRRQILLVTHNPNLAVVCDADQIVFAYMDKNDGNRIHYLCGSIENPTINPILVDVLEGTWPALSKRESMYHKDSISP